MAARTSSEVGANTFQVVNTRIRSGGGIHGSGSGVKLEQSAANEIANNEISEMPRYGISLKGSTVALLRQFQPQLGATQQTVGDAPHGARPSTASRHSTNREFSAGVPTVMRR